MPTMQGVMFEATKKENAANSFGKKKKMDSEKVFRSTSSQQKEQALSITSLNSATLLNVLLQISTTGQNISTQFESI